MGPQAALSLLLFSLHHGTDQASVRVSPARSQFSSGDSLSLSCEDRDWTLRKNSSSGTRSLCKDWGTENGSSCEIKTLYTLDTGLYWCESREGQTSDIVNITFTERGVTLLVQGERSESSRVQVTTDKPWSSPAPGMSNSPSSGAYGPRFLGILLAVLLLCVVVFLISVILFIKNSFWKKPTRAEPRQTSPNNVSEVFYVSVKKRDKCNKPNKTNVTEEDVEYSYLSFPSSAPNS